VGGTFALCGRKHIILQLMGGITEPFSLRENADPYYVWEKSQDSALGGRNH